jgi:hypothetical protein
MTEQFHVQTTDKDLTTVVLPALVDAGSEIIIKNLGPGPLVVRGAAEEYLRLRDYVKKEPPKWWQFWK